MAISVKNGKESKAGAKLTISTFSTVFPLEHLITYGKIVYIRKENEAFMSAAYCSI